MRVAIVHDWLYDYAGSERVLEQIIKIYPDADLFALFDFFDADHRQHILNKPVNTSFLQNAWFIRRHYRKYLPLMPLAVEQFDLSAYDLVISSSHAVAKGVLTGPDQLHISYVHSPIRYAWDLQHQYLKESGLAKGLQSWLARYLLHRMRIWDARTANGVDYFVANSSFIARRIHKVYRREAHVIHPPVDVDLFTPGGEKEDFYLTVSRMVPYKRVDLIVESFKQMPERRLLVIGDGPEMQRIKAKAASNVTFLGFQSSDVIRDYLRRARAFVFAAVEDFGILPVEAQACGTPVIAYGRGGVLESVRGARFENATGVFYADQTVEALLGAIESFESLKNPIRAETCRQHAEKFNNGRFRTEFSEFVHQCLENSGKTMA